MQVLKIGDLVKTVECGVGEVVAIDPNPRRWDKEYWVRFRGAKIRFVDEEGPEIETETLPFGFSMLDLVTISPISEC